MIRNTPLESLIIRPSRSLSFRGGEIWVEELDALAYHTAVAVEKFRMDMRAIRRPSTPSHIAVALYGTYIGEELAACLAEQLAGAGGAVRKVAFIGLERAMRNRLNTQITASAGSYAYAFFDDFEKGKEWLIPA